MGELINIKCNKCFYMSLQQLGMGMRVPFILDYLNDRDFAKEVGKKRIKQLRTLNKNDKIREYNFYYQIYYCKKCHSIENQSKYKIKYEEENTIKTIFSRHHCSKCGGRMINLDSLKGDELKCPECGENSLSIDFGGFWD